MQVTALNKLVSQLLIGILAMIVALTLIDSWNSKLWSVSTSTPEKLLHTLGQYSALALGIFGLAGLAAIAVVGLAFEALSLLYVQPLLRTIADAANPIFRFYPRPAHFDNLPFWREEFGRAMTRARFKARSAGRRQIDLPDSIANDEDKIRGLAVVLFLDRSGKGLYDWTISHFGTYYFLVAALQLLYIAVAGEVIITVAANPIHPSLKTSAWVLAMLPAATPIAHAFWIKRDRADGSFPRWVKVAYATCFLMALLTFLLQSFAHLAVFIVACVAGYLLLFLALDKYNYTYAMVYRFGCLYLLEKGASQPG